jgi:hypothetical protein
MVAGQPATRCADGGGELTKALIGGFAAILRKIARGQDQVDLRLFLQHLFDHSLQAVAGIHAQQLTVRFGEQMTVG